MHRISSIRSFIVLYICSFACGIAATERRPNFLFIYTDDQRWDALGIVQREQGEKARFPWLETPHLDRLAAEGMRFRNAFVVLSLCSPSRAAFMTGRYNHLNGVVDNRTPFPATSVTHATALKPAGYINAYIGKWHMGNQRGHRPGFDYSASFVNQGKYFDCPFEINGESTPTKGWIDDVSTDYAIDFMRQNRDQPFSVVLGFKATHGAFLPPERAKNRFAGAVARSVPNIDVRAIYRDPQAVPPDVGKPGLIPESAPKASDGTYPIDLGYFRCASAIDDNVGRLLQALDELGIADDTVVVFSSDNGYFFGEHGLGDKRAAYEEALRIPLLVRYPKLIAKGSVCDELALNIDLAPTFADLGGVSVPRQMQGRSWRPLFEGRNDGWRDSFLAEYFFEAQYPLTPTFVAVRTRAAKLITYPGHDEWTELFDLSSDPYETRNLAADPKHEELLARMTSELEAQKKATLFRIPAPTPSSSPNSAKKKNQGKSVAPR
jgi:arylsulfatase A-like enzyme